MELSLLNIYGRKKQKEKNPQTNKKPHPPLLSSMPDYSLKSLCPLDAAPSASQLKIIAWDR